MDYRPKIRIIPQQNNAQTFNPQLQNVLQSKIFSVQNEIENQQLNWTLDAEIEANQQNYQKWKFGFKGEETVYIDKEEGRIEKKFPFGNKIITGTLIFPNNYPQSAPTFYFNPVGNQAIQHINIYGDNSFCVPLLTYWQTGISELEILMSIVHIFHHPNFAQNDAAANPVFSTLSENQQFEIQFNQAQQMEDF